MTLKDLHKKVSGFSDTVLMPVLFIGHGSPMNVIEENDFTRTWANLSTTLPQPSAIVCISAHWETRGTYVTIDDNPKTIHDFYGFPGELYEQIYLAQGSPQLAREVIEHITNVDVRGTSDWGLDHGAWSVLKYLYPKANIPVIQVSIDHYKDARWHYELGKELSFLRSKGVLVIGSGNMVHNLRMIRVEDEDFNAEYGYEWAYDMNNTFKEKITKNDHWALVDYQSLNRSASLAIPTPEHYIPMLYALGMKNESENIKIFNDRVIAGSLSMTSFVIGDKLNE